MTPSIFLVFTACFSAKTPPKAMAENPTPTEEIKQETPEIKPPEKAGTPIHDFHDELIIQEMTAELVQTNPIQILYTLTPPFDQPEKLLEWMDINVELYLYLPSELREREDFKKKAVQNGIQMGLEITEAVTARTKPNINAREALYASDTTNGYLTGPRELQQFEQGDILKPIKSIETASQTWYLITEEETSDREQEERTFPQLSNVGGVSLEDFSFGTDAGWIPASATKSVIFADQYISEIYTFEDAVNGDLGIYVDFKEISFDGFELEYNILEAYEQDRLLTGDKIRIIWRKPASATEEPEIIWVPTFPEMSEIEEDFDPDLTPN